MLNWSESRSCNPESPHQHPILQITGGISLSKNWLPSHVHELEVFKRGTSEALKLDSPSHGTHGCSQPIALLQECVPSLHRIKWTWTGSKELIDRRNACTATIYIAKPPTWKFSNSVVNLGKKRSPKTFQGALRWSWLTVILLDTEREHHGIYMHGHTDIEFRWQRIL